MLKDNKQIELDKHILRISIDGVTIYESEKVKRLRELGTKFLGVDDICYKGDNQECFQQQG